MLPASLAASLWPAGCELKRYVQLLGSVIKKKLPLLHLLLPIPTGWKAYIVVLRQLHQGDEDNNLTMAKAQGRRNIPRWLQRVDPSI